VRLEALAKIGGDTYIMLRGNGNALEKIYILHDCPPKPWRRGNGKKVACHPKLWRFPERRVVEPKGIEPSTS
jgi:hypothetical protein